MIAISISPEGLHSSLRITDLDDLQDLVKCGSDQMMWLLVPVFASVDNTFQKQLANEVPTRIEFATLAER